MTTTSIFFWKFILPFRRQFQKLLLRNSALPKNLNNLLVISSHTALLLLKMFCRLHYFRLIFITQISQKYLLWHDLCPVALLASHTLRPFPCASSSENALRVLWFESGWQGGHLWLVGEEGWGLGRHERSHGFGVVGVIEDDGEWGGICLYLV